MKSIFKWGLQLILILALFLVYSLPSSFIVLGYQKISITLIFVVLLALISYYLSQSKNRKLPALFQWKHLGYIALGYISIYICNIILMQFLETKTTSNNETIYELANNINPTTLFLLLCVLAPIGEEIIFRFSVINLFVDTSQEGKKKYKFIGLIVSAMLFALPHVPTLDSIPAFLAYASMGAIMGMVYLKSRRIEVSMALHFINNLIPYLIITFAPHLL